MKFIKMLLGYLYKIISVVQVVKHSSSCSVEFIRLFDLLQALYNYITSSVKRREVCAILFVSIIYNIDQDEQGFIFRIGIFSVYSKFRI